MRKKHKSKLMEPLLESTHGIQMSRKEAIKKTGYIALSAATMMLLLSKPVQAQSSPAAPPDSDWP